ncbi:MAG TPA: hypothetical protein VN455_10605, partial [Methanotrichaceae archaeon]|nr:hypothetical protein [Methanotrichaceae archaeon]
RSELYDQIYMHPERFFFILAFEGCAGLCIQTCDDHGEDIKIQEIGGLRLNSEGDSISVFQEELKEAMTRVELCQDCPDGQEYPITPAIKKKIGELPGFIDWIMASVRANGRCLLVYPSWNIS